MPWKRKKLLKSSFASGTIVRLIVLFKRGAAPPADVETMGEHVGMRLPVLTSNHE
jgi:hypothetical protein